MAEKIVSPGVFTNEVDQSFLPAGVAAIGAALVGPTDKGPAGIPTIVSSYSEFVQIFGGKFSSGSGASENSYKFLTNYAAQEYLKYADTLTVVRVAPGATPATSTATTSGTTTTGLTFASGSLTLVTNSESETFRIVQGSNTVKFIAQSSPNTDASDGTINFFARGGSATALANNLATEINANSVLTGLVASNVGAKLILSSSVAGTAVNDVTFATASAADPGTFGSNAVTSFTMGDGTESAGTAENCFTLTTLTDGANQNSLTAVEGTNNTLASGSENNIRYEITSVNNAKGSFNMLIRRGDDTSKRKIILEQYNNLTLDPNDTNYIGRRIGDQVQTVRDAGGLDPFLQMSGSFANRSKFVRVTVHKNTYNYLDANGNIRDNALSGSLPSVQSGSFSGASDGTSRTAPMGFYDTINNTNSQGIAFDASGNSAYIDAIRLLKNQDEYDINLLTLPGVIDNFSNHAAVITEAVNMVESRADCFLVVDPIGYAEGLSSATARAEARDSNYVAE